MTEYKYEHKTMPPRTSEESQIVKVSRLIEGRRQGNNYSGTYLLERVDNDKLKVVEFKTATGDINKTPAITDGTMVEYLIREGLARIVEDAEGNVVGQLTLGE